VLKVDIPDFEKMRLDKNLAPEEYVSRMKEKGIAPPRKYREKPIVLTCIQGVLDPYVPPEGDGKFSVLSKAGVKQKGVHLKQKASTMLAIRKIRTYEDDFDVPTFGAEALQIYIKAHELLAAGKKEELLDYVTDFVYPQMTFQTDRRTIKWTFIKENELPRVAQVRTHSLIDKENIFAQITMRFNTRQILAVYDRFGYLIHGSDAVVKDVLEYVVYEKNISDYNGKWRLHSKIIPDWLPKKDPIFPTFVRGPRPDPPTEQEIKFFKEGILSDEKKEEEKESNKGNESSQVATA